MKLLTFIITFVVLIANTMAGVVNVNSAAARDPKPNELISPNMATTGKIDNISDNLFCWPVPGQDWQQVNVKLLTYQISYLNGLSIENCSVGPRSCSRISCSYSTAVFLCNDNDYQYNIQCTFLAPYVQYISDTCQSCWTVPGIFPPVYQCDVAGQIFGAIGSSGLNIVVRYDNTGGC